eukprot:6114592-Prymnesium_polylepis.1
MPRELGRRRRPRLLGQRTLLPLPLRLCPLLKLPEEDVRPFRCDHCGALDNALSVGSRGSGKRFPLTLIGWRLRVVRGIVDWRARALRNTDAPWA